MTTPTLEGDAARAVAHRGTHLQIIAAAGSGKTEVVSQRVVQLLADGEPARSIVAFTFTERAAAELKERIVERVEDRLGRDALDRVGGLFVGTIHAYCFRLLQQYAPRYETFDVLDENRLNAFLGREAHQLGLKALDPADKNRLYASITEFLRGLDVVENELLEVDQLDDPFRSVYEKFLERLERYRVLSFGQQIVRAIAELRKPEVAAEVHRDLRHLIVDEYQDVNPAQEELIRLLTGPDVELCVVGDDDQAIYGWRGSDVDNIVTFAKRYPSVETFELVTNRRSRPEIIETANSFAASIPNRLPKTMGASRKASPFGSSVVPWSAEDELSEAGYIASLVLDLNEAGVAFRDIAVLVRTRAAYAKILEQFASFDIPVQPGGRTGLFDQPEARVLGRTVVWLVDYQWRDSPFGWGVEDVDLADLVSEYVEAFQLPTSKRRSLRTTLEEWKASTTNDRSTVDLIRDYYGLLDLLDVRRLDLTDPIQSNRLGTLARFSELLADYEAVNRRARVDQDNPGEQVGAVDRGIWYFRGLATTILNYAMGAYEAFDGEADIDLDAVDITTVHRSKGLEWPVVVVPSLTKSRFPSGRAGRAQDWPIPRDLFAADRYEGGDDEERRLFYVAMTRARDLVSLSRHDRVTKKAAGPSPYWQEVVASAGEADPDAFDLPEIEGSGGATDSTLQLTFSDIAAFLECAQAFRLRSLYGFQPRLAPELGYGKAVHHVLRMVAEQTKATGKVPSKAALAALLDNNFFLPAANKPAHRQLKAAAERLVTTYATDHKDDLFRIWETERPFELHLNGIVVSGRADVVLDREDGVETALALVDYKTSTSGDHDHDLQLQVYTDAGRREGLDMRGAYVHDLKAGERTSVAIDGAAIGEAELTVTEAAARIRAKDYTPSPGKQCRTCEVRAVCSSAT